jgi:hypothetical protein
VSKRGKDIAKNDRIHIMTRRHLILGIVMTDLYCIFSRIAKYLSTLMAVMVKIEAHDVQLETIKYNVIM